jgi:hypothetical protein
MATLVSSGTLYLTDIRDIIHGAGAATLVDCNTGTEGGLGSVVLKSQNCGWGGPSSGGGGEPMTDWYNYTDAFEACENAGVYFTTCCSGSCGTYSCGANGVDTYDVYYAGCCTGYVCYNICFGCC